MTREESGATPPSSGGAWLYVFFGVQIAAQLALAFTGLDTARVFVRVSAFAVSLFLLAWSLLVGKHPAYPAKGVMGAIVVVLGLSLLQPTTNGWLSGAVQVGLYCAVLAPLVWAPRLGVDFTTFRRAMLLLWAFHAASAAVGVIQVYRPDTLQPNVSTVVQNSQVGTESLQIMTSSGEVILRPMGLSDVPGGAAASGLYAVLLGAGIVMSRGGQWLRAAAGASMLAGMASIYLSQVRIALVVVVVTLATLTLILLRRHGMTSTTRIVGYVGVAAAGGFILATSLAEEAVVDRLATLVEDRPTAVYYANRGQFVESTLDLAGDFPLGAGLGRWGMTHAYFGEQSTPERGAIWVEIQWTGWVVDGGIPLVILYVTLLVIALRMTLRIGIGTTGERPGSDEIGLWSAVVSAYTVGVLALTFTYPIFLSQAGMEFWVMSASIFSAAALRSRPGATTVNGAIHGNLPAGRGRLRAHRRDGHGEPGARPVPGRPGPLHSSGEPPRRP